MDKDGKSCPERKHDSLTTPYYHSFFWPSTPTVLPGWPPGKKCLTKTSFTSIFAKTSAEVAELVDALGSGSSGGIPVEVRVFSSAPMNKKSFISFFQGDKAFFIAVSLVWPIQLSRCLLKPAPLGKRECLTALQLTFSAVRTGHLANVFALTCLSLAGHRRSHPPGDLHRPGPHHRCHSFPRNQLFTFNTSHLGRLSKICRSQLLIYRPHIAWAQEEHLPFGMV